MNSFRIKIVISLIGLSLVCYALGAYNSRSLLLESFEGVVSARTADGFARDALDYFRTYGSWEAAVKSERFETFRQRKGFPPPPGNNQNRPGFLLTDLEGKVWVQTPAVEKSPEVGKTVSSAQLTTAIPLSERNEIAGYIITVGELLPSEIEDQYLKSITNTWWISLLVVAAVAIPVGVFLGKRLADPINDLIRAISAMGPSTMRQKVLVKSNDELGLLSCSFNTMSDDMADFVQVIKNQREKIIETQEVLRHDLVNISHELRTPLNTSVSQAQAMLDGVRALDHEQMQKLATSLDHLTRLVDELHQLSLADVKAAQYEEESLDFVGLVKECISAREEDFRQKEFDQISDLPTELLMHGDSTRLRQIVENLLENTVRYSDQCARVSVKLSQHDENAVLEISDSGPGVPEDSLISLFDRFYRVDSSRNRATGGTGLGLSLVKSYAEIHGGNVEAFKSPLGGLGIRVHIPVK